MILFENELEFATGSDIISERFVNPDKTIEYCGSWGKIQFNKDECLKSISATVYHFIQLPKKEIYFECDRESILEIQSLLLSEICEIINSYAVFVC